MIILILLAYWLYLAFNTKMEVVFDSIDYMNSGKLIHDGGNYFTSLHREILYPFFVSMAMNFSDWQFVLALMGVVVLTVSVLLSEKIMDKLNINDWIKNGVILYMGISPSIINAAFSLYSEIIVIPIVLGVVLVSL